MKKFVLAAFALATLFSCAPLFAQSTGISPLAAIGDDVAGRNGYTAVLGSNTVLLKDSQSGRTLFVIKEINQQTVTLSSVVASLRQLSNEKREALLRRIAHYNISSDVGTLWFDAASGEVTMEHHVNPRMVSIGGIVAVAMRFGDAVRAEQAVLLQ